MTINDHPSQVEYHMEYITPTRWQQLYNIKCSQLKSNITDNCLAHLCLETMKDISDINNQTEFSNMRLKASHFVAMLTWELASNSDMLEMLLNSEAYEHLVKTTVAIAFYDNNTYNSTYQDLRRSKVTKLFLKLQWLGWAMASVQDEEIWLWLTKEQQKTTTSLRANKTRLQQTMSKLDSSTGPFVEALLHTRFYNTTTRENDDAVNGTKRQKSRFPEQLEGPTIEHEYEGQHKIYGHSVLYMVNQHENMVDIDEKINFYDAVTVYLTQKPLVQLHDTTKIVVNIDKQSVED